MVEPRRLITPEIAAEYDVSPHTVTKSWSQHTAWPTPVGKRGRYKEYDAQDVDNFVRNHVRRQAPALKPRRLYTAQDLEAAGIGITAGTIRADLSRGRWPNPDDTTGGVNRWTGTTATQALEGRRNYRRSTQG
ncbi:hypothetical protein AB0K66_04430 [Streptomyces werraensis]|uniref:hypothetical protein n=1 Tax=Streptomyces werraensis TaxID=68284 RepID=UPI0034407838